MKTTIELTPDELSLLIEALDSHAYWQVSTDNQRHDGYVNHEEDDENHEELTEIEALAEKLAALSAAMDEPAT